MYSFLHSNVADKLHTLQYDTADWAYIGSCHVSGILYERRAFPLRVPSLRAPHSKPFRAPRSLLRVLLLHDLRVVDRKIAVIVVDRQHDSWLHYTVVAERILHHVTVVILGTVPIKVALLNIARSDDAHARVNQIGKHLTVSLLGPIILGWDLGIL